MIRIVLADDHPVVRAGLCAMLDGDTGLEVIGEAATPDDSVALVTDLAPDIVLMDLQFGVQQTGADATRRIRSLPEPPAVLVLTNYDSDGDILGAVEAGASGSPLPVSDGRPGTAQRVDAVRRLPHCGRNPGDRSVSILAGKPGRNSLIGS